VRVAIVGAGFSGLSAARSLRKLGHDCTIFEARDYVGGRCRTVREGDVRFEAGGEWIDADHDRLLSLIQEFGLTLKPSPHEERGIFRNGTWMTVADLDTTTAEDEERFYSRADAMVSRVSKPAWSNLALADLDRQPLTQLLEEECQTELGRWWLTADLRSDEGEDLDRISTLGWLVGYQNYTVREGTEMSAFRLAEGMQTLAERMADGLDIRLNSEVRKIEWSSDQTLVGGEAFDAVVLTVPPTVTDRVSFQPPLPAEKTAAINACRLGRTIKLTWQFDRAFWTGTPGSGNLYLDNDLQQVWDASLGSAPILSAYICGAGAERILANEDPVTAGLALLESAFPEAKEAFVRGWLSDWIHDPYTQGAFSFLGLRYVTGGMEHVSAPAGRLHFAGEHTSEWLGFIEGALESGERVAAEVHLQWS